MTQKSATNGHVTTARRDRFSSGATVRLALSDGDWVLVRQELTYGQERRLFTAGLSGVPGQLAEGAQADPLRMDYAAFEIERLCTWVVDWSFVDGDGAHVVVSREAIEALHPETAKELQQALDAHVREWEAKKGAPAGATASAATSPSARPSAGAGTPS